MAKRVIQLYDKYKSTTKVYPLIVGESITPDAKEEIAKIADAEIEEKVTEVVANPELAGTEADLESIKIGDTKYKIGGGKQLYQHNCVLYGDLITQGYPAYIYITIFSSNPNVMVKNDLQQFLIDNGFDGSSFSKVYNIVDIYSNYPDMPSQNLKGIAWNGTRYCSVQLPTATVREYVNTSFTDKVIPL